MPKTSKKAEFTENADRSITAVTFKEMKHNFSKYMTKFGAHIVHLFSFAGSNVYKILKNAMVFIGNKIAPNFRRINKEFKYIGKEIQSHCYLTKDYFAEMLADAKEIKAEDGVFSSVKYCLRSIGQKIWNKRGFAVTAFNWTAPVVSIAFLVGVVSYAADVQYGVSVECNGQKLGVVAEESIYDEAEKEMQQRITYVDDNKTISISPKLSVQAVKTTTKIVNSNQLADQMIVNSDAELLNAYGVYVDGQFVGAVADKKPVENALASVLAKYDTTGAKEVSLSKDVDYRQGFYLKSSLVPAAKINQTLTSNKQVEVKYTIQKDDTPIIIADKNNISLAQLMSLNPNIVSDCTVGDQVLLTQAEPFIAVKMVKDIQYEDDIKYDTVKVENSSAYKGTEKTLVKGEDGEALVTAEVTIVNGYEVGRNILRQDVVKQPVTEKISVGTMILSPAKGKVVSGSGSYGWPVAGGHITSGFGDGRGHKGVDIVAPKGTGIYAAESGTVILSQWYYGYGYCIKIQHSDGNVTLYGHQSKLIAKVGQQVDRGELIGLVGNTGDSDGNHCHFEIMRNGSYMNPSKFIGG